MCSQEFTLSSSNLLFSESFLESNKTNEPFSNVFLKCFLLKRTLRGFEIGSKGKNNNISNKLFKTLNRRRLKFYLMLQNQGLELLLGFVVV